MRIFDRASHINNNKGEIYRNMRENLMPSAQGSPLLQRHYSGSFSLKKYSIHSPPITTYIEVLVPLV